MTDVFISYASVDKSIANNILEKLEQSNHPCWIAPRDIQAGEEYAEGIIRGIDHCKCMVIVFSEASNHSKHVLREVERAVGHEIVIIPFRISEITPSGSMDYFLKIAHWLDAKDMKLDHAIDKLTLTIGKILDQPSNIKVSADPITQQEPVQKKNKPVWGLAALLLVSVLSVVAYFYIDQNKKMTLSKPAMLEALIQQNGVLVSEASKQNIDSMLDISVGIPNKLLGIKAWLEPKRAQFMQGDKIKFKVSLDKDAYLAVYVHSMDGSTYLIYPNHLAPPEILKKDTVFTVGSGKAFELEIAEPFGIDVVQFIATTGEDDFKHLMSKHTPLNGMTISIVNRDELKKEIRGVGIKGIAVKKSTAQANTEENNLWGEAIILLNTRPAE